MGLFKSKRDRAIRRDIEIKKGVARIKRQISDLEKAETQWLTKAQRGKSLGAGELALPRAMLKKTMQQRRLLEKQQLIIESALQMKNQMETFEQFATSMRAVAKSMEVVFKTTDLVKTQAQFETAITKAKTFEQMMDVFLDMSGDTIMEGEDLEGAEVVSDAEIDELLGVAEGKSGLDEDLEQRVKAVERELGAGP